MTVACAFVCVCEAGNNSLLLPPAPPSTSFPLLFYSFPGSSISSKCARLRLLPLTSLSPISISSLFEILFFSKRKVGTATNVTVALGKDTAGTRSAARDKAGKARRAQPEARRGEEREEREGKEGKRRGGERGCTHPTRTQLARQARRSELRDNGSEGKEKGGGGGGRRGEERRRGGGAAGTQSERS